MCEIGITDREKPRLVIDRMAMPVGAKFRLMDDLVTVTIVDVNPVRDTVLFGFEADRSIVIDREEIHAMKNDTRFTTTEPKL